VRTDRAHVTIAAALLSKQVEYRSSNYHKVPAIVDYSLQGYPVHCMTSNGASENNPAWIVAEQRPTGCEPPTASGGHLAWTEALRLSVQDLAELVPEGASLVLVDDDNIGPLPLYSRRRLPFLERDGEYWGPPLDDATAVRELGRLRQGGATFIVFAWPAFWWLEYYSGLHEHLRTNFRCALHNDRLVAFDLRG
jgi:hypothetical protein